jgi:hypothetical protein
VDRYLTDRTGDVKKLKPPLTGFAAATTACSSGLKDENSITITAVRNRREAYR